jgi:hypothetical protein
MNSNDLVREAIVKYLFKRHQTARGPGKIGTGIRDLQKGIKDQYGFKQSVVTSNLDFLVQNGWVVKESIPRTFKTTLGTVVSSERIQYKISYVGISKLESASIYQKPKSLNNVNITTINGVTIVGDGNVVNTAHTDLSSLLDEIEKHLYSTHTLSDEQKLNASGDISTIRAQIAKKSPDYSIIQKAWSSLETISTLGGVAELVKKIGELICPYMLAA